jgi:hypothetical protein
LRQAVPFAHDELEAHRLEARPQGLMIARVPCPRIFEALLLEKHQGLVQCV